MEQRKTSKAALAENADGVDKSGRVLREQRAGPQNEMRRARATVNAMYYDPQTQIVVDYHKGIRDAQKLVLRMSWRSGHAARPVHHPRRACATPSSAGLRHRSQDGQAAGQIATAAGGAQGRMFDEMLKLLQTGHALASVDQLRKLEAWPRAPAPAGRGGGAGRPALCAGCADGHRPPRGRRQERGTGLFAGMRAVADVKAGWDARLDQVFLRSRRCGMRLTKSSTSASVMCRAAAAWL